MTMFSDCEPKSTGFISSWKTEKKLRENASQTSAILTYEAENQTQRPRDAKCQTDSLADLMKSQTALSDGFLDLPSLASFLATVEPMISKQLKINNAASGLYSDIAKMRSSSMENSITCEHSLYDDSIVLEKGSPNLEATNVCWSSSGAAIVVAYGTNQSMAWSENKSCICEWNLDRPKLNPRQADHKLEVESSVHVVSCHPEYPGYIAAGLFSGVVLVWNLAKDEVIYGESPHEDPVTSLCWLQHPNSKYLRLVSASTDGRLILWRIRKDKESSAMKIDKTMRISGQYLPRRAGVKGHGAVGVTCFTPLRSEVGYARKRSTPSASGVMMVGCENGSVLKCSLDGEGSNPVAFVYDNHNGPVYSVDCSPFHRHLFLTTASDQICRIYHALQPAPLREIHPTTAGSVSRHIYSAAWSPTRPCLLFITGSVLEAFDVRTACSITSTSQSSFHQCEVNHMVINPTRFHSIATACSDGSVHTWRIGARLVDADDVIKEETAALEGVANEAMN
uniref:Uncharacterized protein n=1 Tax=Ciona savignyi TaxID=51511 RepID=H2YGY3_CIOSA